MRTALALLCVLMAVLARPVAAGAVVQVSQHQVTANGINTTNGSGTVIQWHGRPHVLSCSHGWNKSGLVKVNGRMTGRFVKLDTNLDLSLIELDEGDAEQLDTYQLARDEPPVGSRVWSGGYVQSRQRGGWKTIEYYNLDHLALDKAHEHGQSGGPVIYDGRVVGVIQGTYQRRISRGSTIRLRDVRRFVEGGK